MTNHNSYQPRAAAKIRRAVFLLLISPVFVFAQGGEEQTAAILAEEGLLTPRPAPARTVSSVDGKDAVTVVEPERASIFFGSLSVTFLNQYNARGIIVQDRGVTIQPFLSLGARLYQGDGIINEVSLLAQWWNDISTNTRVSAPGSQAPYWTETDIIGGLSVRFLDRFTISSIFNQFLTPAGGYNQGRFINTVVSYDDAGQLIPNFAFRPQFTFLAELPDIGQAGLQPDAWYYEPGLTPNYTLFAKSDYPVNIALPLRLGLGTKFYNGTPYGFFSVGPQITVPLAFISSAAARWNLTAGYQYYNLGSTTAAIAPGGNANQNLFNVGVGVSF